MITEVVKKKEPDIKRVTELSEHLLKKFAAKVNCKHCWSRGIQMIQFTPKSDFTYVPCVCLKAK